MSTLNTAPAEHAEHAEHSASVVRARRAGMTLVEMLVAMSLLAIVATGVYTVLINHQRAFGAQIDLTDLRQNIRAAAGILPPELRELDAVDGDILAMSPTSITIRAMRQTGIVCVPPVLGGASTNGLTVTVRTPLYSALRDFTTTDSVLIWYEGDPAKRTDDGWVRGNIVSMTATTCPDARPGVRLTTNLTLSAGQPNAAQAIPAGVPIRGYEIVTYSLYTDTDGRKYLALTSGNTTSPVIGPLLPDGLTFSYLDKFGAATTVPTSVAEITTVLRAQTARPIRQRSGTVAATVDSAFFTVSLRNNPRF